jgi:hypothetical protein
MQIPVLGTLTKKPDVHPADNVSSPSRPHFEMLVSNLVSAVLNWEDATWRLMAMY